ncbi:MULTISPECIES: glycosyltransferase family 2 protein [Flectobacillus]|jgi:glycosyltransferase involved in cell wall biosynthesis|uniref:glycosyltransferase family 2 protein n=1 Tax=Flectobacillus TaxID=101 RepID=UPI000BA2ED0C|nr:MULTISPECIES: glycosyltransferase family 2 protein [Flectobacillus]MDI9871479.1 glycosyltransferase family 2 protein [Flectobacillus roseus]PAC32923.1 glycosyl transferase [Flectobacillus sp. BAB-3569]
MKITIITVSFNSEATIKQTIDSVLAQDYPDVEYIVVDGASKDGTVDILKSYGDRIKYISEKDKGIYDALNKGLKLATGDVVGTIGSDDFLPNSSVLGHVAEAFIQTGKDVIYGDLQYINPDNDEKIVRYWSSGEYKVENWLKGWMPPHLSCYIKREAFEKYGNYIIDFSCSGDYELMLRMMYKHRLSAGYIPEVLMTMRNGGTSTASWKHRYRANMEDRRAWELNQLQPKWYTLWMKPLSKISQLFT